MTNDSARAGDKIVSANIRAMQNRKYLRNLLDERQPVFAAILQAAERQIDRELSRGTNPGSAHPCGGRRPMNTAWLYHLDRSVCVHHWSCREIAHPTLPPPTPPHTPTPPMRPPPPPR